MHKIFNRFLLFTFISLSILLAVRILSNSLTTVVPVAHTVIEEAPQHVLSQKEVEKIIDNYLKNNPQLIVASVDLIQKHQTEEIDKIKYSADEKKVESDNTLIIPHLGNKKGNLNVTVFFDYNCGHCKKSAPVMEALLKDPINNDVKILLKPYPVVAPNSMHLSQIAFAVYKNYPDKFSQIHKQLLETQGSLSNEDIDKILTTNGIDIEKIKFAIADNNPDPSIQNSIKKIFELASANKVDSVPSYIINEQVHSGNLEKDNLQSLINEIRQKNSGSTNEKTEVKEKVSTEKDDKKDKKDEAINTKVESKDNNGNKK